MGETRYVLALPSVRPVGPFNRHVELATARRLIPGNLASLRLWFTGLGPHDFPYGGSGRLWDRYIEEILMRDCPCLGDTDSRGLKPQITQSRPVSCLRRVP